MRALRKAAWAFWLLLLPAAGPALAEQTRALSWVDLAPETAVVPDRLDAISADNRENVEYIAWARNMEGLGMMPANSGPVRHAVVLAGELEAQGIDVDALVALSEIKRRREERLRNSFVETLDGASVRIEGFVAPVKRAGLTVTEFILVPDPRSCSHVPPVPNQAILVRVPKGIPMGSPFRPSEVAVAGRLIVAAAKRSLYLVDGPVDLGLGYTMDDPEVIRLR